MAAYCLELDGQDVIIHTTLCGSYDHGSLLGQGRLYSLGDFDSAQLALNAARTNHAHATLCLDCCKPAFGKNRVALRGSTVAVDSR